ncbi:MAG: hypothetical protein JXN61_09905, partial [Sedimentisphaerales bacterium]|nr:hypothetical protein [Sedimentisphaerales bacterium]
MDRAGYICIVVLAFAIGAGSCLAAEDASNTVITIDVSKKAEPISKYIYGQFIEHLGRCIDGGIWAEMLEDRKFYHPVGAGKSPWKPLGDTDSVKMAAKDAYVGDHEPEISVEPAGLFGICQDKLGLVEGKEYTGRIILAASQGVNAVELRLRGDDSQAAFHSHRIEGIAVAHAAYTFRIHAPQTTDNGHLEILGVGKGAFRIGVVSLMP